jgi:hypothetical protein
MCCNMDVLNRMLNFLHKTACYLTLMHTYIPVKIKHSYLVIPRCMHPMKVLAVLKIKAHSMAYKFEFHVNFLIRTNVY